MCIEGVKPVLMSFIADTGVIRKTKNSMLWYSEESTKITNPARSTKWSLARFIVALAGSLDEMWIVNIQCDLVDAWFIGVW